MVLNVDRGAIGLSVVLLMMMLMPGCTLMDGASAEETPVLRALLHELTSYDQARRDIITSEQDWQAWWAGHAIERPMDGSDPVAPTIDVDFTREMLIAVTSGRAPISCINVTVASAERNADEVRLDVVTHEGGTTCLQAKTAVADVVALSPLAKVVFVNTTVSDA